MVLRHVTFDRLFPSAVFEEYLWTQFGFESAGKRYFSVRVPDRQRLEQGMSVIALLAAPDGFETDRLLGCGLLDSSGIQQASPVIPTVGESNECMAIRQPRPEGRMHLVLFPKRDVRNVLELQPEDGPYVLVCFALPRTLADLEGFRNYRHPSHEYPADVHLDLHLREA